jgi:hypothetical protein
LDSATRWKREDRKVMTLDITSGLSSSAIVVDLNFSVSLLEVVG